MELAVVIPTWDPVRLKVRLQLMRHLQGKDILYVVVHPEGEAAPSTNGSVMIPYKERFSMLDGFQAGYETLPAEIDLVMFMHDDVDVLEPDWDLALTGFMEAHPECGLVGFGGARHLGSSDLYRKPYQLIQLARSTFCSNMKEWSSHGKRILEPMRAAVLDGFCEVFRRDAFEEMGTWYDCMNEGLTFHCYDLWAACRMVELEWETWVLPLKCHHYGGLTSTSAKYDEWLRSQGIAGDTEVHTRAHKIIYERFRNVLPLRT